MSNYKAGWMSMPNLTWSGIRTRVLTGIAQTIPDAMVVWVLARMHRRIEGEMAQLVAKCDPAGVFVDVGAWYGPWSYWMADRVTSVVSIEPNPIIATSIRKVLPHNVEVLQCALSDQPGVAELRTPSGSFGLEGTATLREPAEFRESVDVEVRTLDDLGLQSVTFVKIDVEGRELSVLLGGKRTIQRDHPVLLVELDSAFGNVRETIGLLRSWGYSARLWRDRAWHELDEESFISEQSAFMKAKRFKSYPAAALTGGFGYPNDVAFCHPSSTWNPWD